VITVAVAGACGRLGSVLSHAIETATDLHLVATIDPSGQAPTSAAHFENLTPEVLIGVDVLLDVTVATSARRNGELALSRGVHVVIGTSGLSDDDRASLEILADQHRCECRIIPNFALGAVLLERLAEQAAKYFESVEVIELHHPDKRDAPSGTAMNTVERLARARGEAGVGIPPDATVTETLPGSRGGVGPGGIHVHSVRLRGLVAHEEILFGSPGEQLSLRHDSFDRSSFVAGALLAIRRVGHQVGVHIGLGEFLDL
jgi:4-hydroxy-tetrahydrodipicolinate reductase